jgi:hypothetical protein
METAPDSEESRFFKKVDDIQSPKKEDYVG